jgi:serine/threonine protein phosphatase 1
MKDIKKALQLAFINEGIREQEFPLIQTFEENKDGRDFVVGDIHGCFSKLNAQLERLSFDKRVDRLFAVGDLVDRGPESDSVVDWLGQSWFHSVRGNHDHFVVEFMEGPFDKGTYLLNGGKWFLETLPEARPYYYNEMKKLPIIIEVKTKHGLVGIVHADIAGNDWEGFKRKLPEYSMYAMWGRQRINGQFGDEIIEGVHRVYVGHTPVEEVGDVGNVRYIDMGVCFNQRREFHLEQIN